jgi:dinuclear metal center YbgI/SA1388 family protein
MSTRSVPLADVVRFLDGYLRTAEIKDYDGALNGLQMENGGHVSRVVAAVDACQASIDHAALDREAGPALLLVHHGLFWDGNQPLTGRRYRRVRALLASDTALYSSHLPLDLHPEVGNNVELARLLGVAVQGTFGMSRGAAIGVWGETTLTRDALEAQLASELRSAVKVMPGGPVQCGRVGIITGGASSAISEARDLGLDTFITGEGPHHTYFDAMEWGLNVFYAGHYATETLGVQALAARLERELGLPWSFHRHPTGL